LSHLKQRKENNCLNCNASVNGRFCSICGQENIEPKESAGHLVRHFFEDITHFDGKFFSSIKYLATKPGFLSAEYVRGRRNNYLNPVRFYIFTSFIVFFLLFTFFGPDKNFIENINFQDEQGNKMAIDSIEKINKKNKKSIDENKKEKSAQDLDFKFNLFGDTSNYRDVSQFDSLVKAGKVNGNWLQKKVSRKRTDIKQRFGSSSSKIGNEFFQKSLHAIPQALFITLPFFALVLKLLYVRRKKYYYVSHLIFSIHLYIFIYLNILTFYILNALSHYFAIPFLHGIAITLLVLILPYVFIAMRNFYNQSRVKTFFKMGLIFFFLIFFTISFAIGLLAYSFFTI
jgi:Protein of unknown function (DUF3667)